MLARMRKSMDDKEQGFTLIELLVVMIIIGILAAIAVPVFLNQRKKAVDTAAKSDVAILGKDMATYMVDSATAPTSITTNTPNYLMNGVATAIIGKRSANMGAVTISTVGVGTPDTTWCVSLAYTGGTTSPGSWSYSAANGLAPTCAG